MSSNNITKGIYFALATVLISGVSNFVNKIAVASIKPPLVFTAEKNVFVGLLIVGILIATLKWKKLKDLKKREIIYLLAIGIIGGSLPFYLFFTGLSQIPAITGALIHKTMFIWVAILAVPFLKEKVSKLQIAAVALLFYANFFIGGLVNIKITQGVLFVFAATLLWAVENILAKKILPKVDPDIVIAARMGIGSLILLAASAVVAPKALSHALIMTQSQWFWMGITVALLLGYVMTWYRALRYAPATVVSAVLVSATLITNILSAIFITHKWTLDMGLQSLITVGAIGLFFMASKVNVKNVTPAKAKS
jgi:drug/metabolite transporter (DMT)-like permease